MIDLHSHILPQIDDGAGSIEESTALLKEAKSAGFNAVFMTPHYIESSMEETIENKNLLIQEIQNQLKEEDIEIDLYCGAEIYISPITDKLLYDKKVETLNNSKYVLLELPRYSVIQYLDEVLSRLIAQKYIPIIAHPERYDIVQKNPNLLIDLINKGVYFQMNYGSIVGYYGKTAQKTAKILLKSNMIQFLGTDVHKAGTIYGRVDKIIRKIKKVIGEYELEKLTIDNPKAVIETQDIEITPPIVYKKKLFGIF